MKKVIYAGIAILILSYGCTKDFDKLSQNPNAIKQGSAATLLSQTIYNGLISRIRAARAVGNELMGYTVYKNERAYTQRFDIRNTLGNDLWNRHYTTLTNLEDMYNRGMAEGNANYQAVALTLKAWLVSELTDTFRDIPYFEASKGDSLNFLPAYNTQEEIYKDLLENLDKAALMFDNSKTMSAEGDILYGSKGSNALQVTAWRKFCNSLRLRLYLRVSNAPEFDGPAKINEIVSNSSVFPIFTTAADQAYIPFTNQEPLYNPYYNATSGDFGVLYAPSTTILQMMQDTADPRLSQYYTRAVSTWTGIKSGFPSGVLGQVTEGGTSYVNYNLHDSPRFGVIMNYDEVQFILAEAALKG
ncbi:SusD/RagB family nutrient-binding outer membrane lipoprotein [Pedobacter sp. BS3]|nr:SusD/RagB family nutrient-binding outer membrane lipoprotein [Pedobacter sp. BS3]